MLSVRRAAQPVSPVDDLEEASGALVLRVDEHRLRWPLLDDDPGVHEDDPVRDLPGEAHLVGDDHHRHPLAGEVAHDLEHLADELRIERGRRLVEQHHVRIHRERTRDRDALLLAARQVRRVGVDLLERARRVRGCGERSPPPPPRCVGARGAARW
jgi:hypothetical protein